MAEAEAEQRYDLALTVRAAMAEKPDAVNALRPRPRHHQDDPTDDDFDETGLAEELASLGFYEGPPP